MIGLDTDILARFYVDDPGDPEAAKQRPIARRIIAESTALFVPLTVILELEWILRAFYGFDRSDFIRVAEHLSALPNVTIENEPRIAWALSRHAEGLDFADALHWAACGHREGFFTFDDRRFGWRAARSWWVPEVSVPAE